jgi:hypothetical protein
LIDETPEALEEKPIPLWQKIAAAVYVAVWAAIVIFWHARFAADAWPPDRSFVGPNLVASFVLVTLAGIVGVLIWPPTRRRMHRFVDKKLAPVHEHLTAMRESHDELHRKLDHVIRHSPEIPDLPPAPKQPKEYL